MPGGRSDARPRVGVVHPYGVPTQTGCVGCARRCALPVSPTASRAEADVRLAADVVAVAGQMGIDAVVV